MCGIAGFYNKKKISITYETMYNMLNVIKHRGPDDSGIVCIDGNGVINVHTLEDAQVCLGFNRLSIRDVSQNGHQPMISDDENVVITFNGEIYNTDDLLQEIKNKRNVVFKGTSDTEILLEYYRIFGIYKTLETINGMYALAIYDKRFRKLYIARDKVGIIPLYILINNEFVSWASEIKAFLKIDQFERNTDIQSISREYMYCNPTSMMYRDVMIMEPGMLMTINLYDGAIKNEKYYILDANRLECKHYTRTRDALQEGKEILADCVRRQLVSDVPLGIQLSGGVDSTLVLNYSTELCGADLKTYSIINSLDESFNEERWIKHALQIRNADARFINVSDEFFIENFEQTIYAFERCVGIADSIGIYAFSKQASKDVTVLLSGEGADEIFGGYGFVADFYSEMKRGKDVNTLLITDEFLLGFDRQIQNYESGLWMLNGFDMGDIIGERFNYIDSLHGTWDQKLIQLWMKEELPRILERQNKVNMANSIENRVPFLDDRMIDFGLRLPVEISVGDVEENIVGYESKYLLKRISEEIYGYDFAYRKKQGMGFMLSKQIRSVGFQKYMNEIVLPGMYKRGLVNMNEFMRKYIRMANGQDVLAVWKAINIEVWHQLFVDGRNVIC